MNNKLNRIREEIKGILSIVMAVAVFISLISHNSLDPSPFTSSGFSDSRNLLGIFGAYISDVLFQAIGYCAYIFPFIIGYYGLNRTLNREKRSRPVSIISTVILVLSISSLCSLIITKVYDFSPGGAAGRIITTFTVSIFSIAGSYLIFISLFFITIMLLFPFSLLELIRIVKDKSKLSLHYVKLLLSYGKTRVNRFQILLRNKKREKIQNEEESQEYEDELIEDDGENIVVKRRTVEDVEDTEEEKEIVVKHTETETPEPVAEKITPLEGQEKPEEKQTIKAEPKREPKPRIKKELTIARGPSNPFALPESEPQERIVIVPDEIEDYQLPSLELLADPPLSRMTPSKDELIAKSRLLEKKLADFDIQGTVTQVYPGPVVAMFEFEPAPGVKINKIVSLSDDLALTLKAMSVRVSPIPGKSALGIEVPNKMKEPVYLKEILGSTVFQNNPAKLVIALGKDIFGNPVVTKLAKMPHLLVAGATGSGKSVGMNSMILSLLYRANPKEVKMLMIDPKLLELSIYNDIPHLLLPVITTPKDSVEALKRIVLEMEYRYKLLAERGSRNIDSFNSKIESEDEFLPYIVIFIDELADLMLVSKREIEEPIARIAQMARAAGIHMIIATQRPSVDVITGVIKANFPSRISFQVSSKVDSRTILDTMGAEKLLGKGDMLFTTPGHKIMRVHGAYVSEDEISEIVDFIKTQQPPDYSAFQASIAEDTAAYDSIPGKEGRDEIYSKAVEVVVASNQASISYIQRRLKIGYNKAARIMEMMEEDGVVGPPVEAGKPREVLIRR